MTHFPMKIFDRAAAKHQISTLRKYNGASTGTNTGQKVVPCKYLCK